MKNKIKYFLNDRFNFLENYIKDNLSRRFYRRSIKRKIEDNKNLKGFQISDEYIKAINKYWKKWDWEIFTEWHKAYVYCSEDKDVRYIPEDIFYKYIEPTLNNIEFAKSYEDKNMYGKLFKSTLMPKTLIRNINGHYYNEDYSNLEEYEIYKILTESLGKEIVIKPSIYSGGGRNIKVLRIEEVKKIIDILTKNYKKDYIVELYLEQSQTIDSLYPLSLNTIRITTLRLNEEIHILSSVLRLGNGGDRVDNGARGGISVGIGNDGKLNTRGIDQRFTRYTEHPHTGKSFKNISIKNFTEVKELASRLHESMLHFDIISWDIGLDKEENPVLIECNLRYQGIGFHQCNNGPLFGDLTDDVLDLIEENE